jgi:hypothetical protein
MTHIMKTLINFYALLFTIQMLHSFFLKDNGAFERGYEHEIFDA